MPFQRGQSGNPGGRPKSAFTMISALRTALRERAADGSTNRQAIARRLVSLALEGNVPAILHIFERIDGKIADPVTISGPNDGPMRFTLNFSENRHDDGDDG